MVQWIFILNQCKKKVYNVLCIWYKAQKIEWQKCWHSLLFVILEKKENDKLKKKEKKLKKRQEYKRSKTDSLVSFEGSMFFC